MWSLNSYSAVHDFWPIEFSNSRLGTSDECGDIVMYGLAFLSASISTANLVTPKFQANKLPHLHNFTALMFIKLVQNIKIISICPQHSQSYFKKEFFLQKLEHTAIRTYKHLPLTVKELSCDVRRFRPALKNLANQIPFILWKSIFTLNGNELYSVCL